MMPCGKGQGRFELNHIADIEKERESYIVIWCNIHKATIRLNVKRDPWKSLHTVAEQFASSEYYVYVCKL